jgi:hypothetical protein
MDQHLDRIDGLAKFLQSPALQLIDSCVVKLHRKLLVVHGWRSLAEQALLYQKGRSLNRATGVWEITDAAQLVTRAKPGTSAHNVITASGVPASMAIDVIPLNPDGTIDWNVEDDFWDDLYEISWKVGLDPLGDPIGSYLAGDKGHFEEPAWRLKLHGLNLTLPMETVDV